MTAKAASLTLLVLVCACGPLPEDAAVDTDPLIIGGLEWEDVSTLEADSVQRARARGVGYLSLPARGTRCTGFVIAPDVVMSNFHCLPDAGAAVGATFDPTRETGTPVNRRIRYACGQWLGGDAELDFALLRCTGRPGEAFGVLGLDPRAPRQGEPIYVVQQNCDYYSNPGCEPSKVLARGQVTGVAGRLSHDADTLGGSSGSPVFGAAEHAVLALHNAGVGDDGHGRGLENRAVPMARIVPYLQAHFPGLQLQALEPASDLWAPKGPDAFEPNDDAAQATRLEAGAQRAELTLHPDDQDVFIIELSQPSDVQVDLRFVHAMGDIDAILTQDELAGPTVATAVSGDDDEHIAVTGLQPGRYLLRVHGYQGASNAYHLSLHVVPAQAPAGPAPAQAPTADTQVMEPNERPAEAPALALPFVMQQGLRIADGADVDYYAFDTDGSPRRITLTFSHAVGDLDLFVEDAEGIVVATSNGTTDQERFEQAFGPGRYFIKVIGYASASGAYGLSVQ